MSELLLCRQPLAAVPYYIEAGALNVYSLEEISWYIQHNVSLLDDDLMSEELCNWIETQMDMKSLADKLRELMRQKAPLHIFVGNILLASGYLNSREVKDTIDLVSTLENRGIEERRKIRGDRLLDKGRYQDAIREYVRLLYGDAKNKMNPALIGDLWHNMGAAYGRLLFYKEAGDCFEKAYQLNHKETSLRSMLATYYMREDRDMMEIQMQRYHVKDQLVAEIGETLKNLAASEENRSRQNRVDRLADKGIEQLKRELEHLLEEYAHNSR